MFFIYKNFLFIQFGYNLTSIGYLNDYILIVKILHVDISLYYIWEVLKEDRQAMRTHVIID